MLARFTFETSISNIKKQNRTISTAYKYDKFQLPIDNFCHHFTQNFHLHTIIGKLLSEYLAGLLNNYYILTSIGKSKFCLSSEK